MSRTVWAEKSKKVSELNLDLVMMTSQLCSNVYLMGNLAVLSITSHVDWVWNHTLSMIQSMSLLAIQSASRVGLGIL